MAVAVASLIVPRLGVLRLSICRHYSALFSLCISCPARRDIPLPALRYKYLYQELTPHPNIATVFFLLPFSSLQRPALAVPNPDPKLIFQEISSQIAKTIICQNFGRTFQDMKWKLGVLSMFYYPVKKPKKLTFSVCERLLPIDLCHSSKTKAPLTQHTMRLW